MAVSIRPAELRLAAKIILGAAVLATLAVPLLARWSAAPRVAAAQQPAAAARPVIVRAVPSPPAPAADPLVIKRVLPIDGPIRFGEWHWDDAGVPAGPIVVTVDLKAQVISVFRGGYEIGAAAAIYGADDKPTPLGVFPITEKDADHVSNLYDAPMPYMLRLTDDGVSIHGSDVADNGLTHGCIGVPTPFAKKLFGAVKLGDKVIVTNGERLELGGAITAA